MRTLESCMNRSRRSFLQSSAAAAAAVGFGVVSEPVLARAHGPLADSRTFPKDAVVINSNENPLGPCTGAREAVIAMAEQGGRYCNWLTKELITTFADMEGLKPEYVRAFPGSGLALQFCVLAFTSPTKSYVTADPSYEAGMVAAKSSGARIAKVHLTKTYSHDVQGMLSAAPDAGLFYICTPNNPTGTLTHHSDIEFLLVNKPKGSVALVDEAYIHFSDGVSALDLVKADRDLIVLRTFSKIYGMAGLRCGLAIARPDLLLKLNAYASLAPADAASTAGTMPITAVAAATASLRHAGLVPERKRINATIREQTFAWLSRQGYSFVPSQSNCFMLDVKRPAKDVISAMAGQNIFIGRSWPVWPTHVRITVGTQPEMERFQAALERVMNAPQAADLGAVKTGQDLDGLAMPLTHC